jgi:GDP-L-fucose synthase
VLSSLVVKLHAAKVAAAPSLTLWGTGSPRRELIHADDVADACLFLLRREGEALGMPLNIGTGEDHSIRELADLVARVVGYRGSIAWDTTRPDGAPRKLLDSSRIRRAHWAPSVRLEDGLRMTYEWYLREYRSGGRAP